MSTEPDRRPYVVAGSFVVSLVAAVLVLWASDAVASRPAVEPCVRDQELSARVAAIVERVGRAAPTLVRDLTPETKDRTMAELLAGVAGPNRHGSNHQHWPVDTAAPRLRLLVLQADPILQYRLLVLLSLQP